MCVCLYRNISSWYKLNICSLTAFSIHFARTYLSVSFLLSSFCWTIWPNLPLLISPLWSSKYKLQWLLTEIACFWLRHFRRGFHGRYINNAPLCLCQKSVWMVSYTYIYSIYIQIFYNNDCAYSFIHKYVYLVINKVMDGIHFGNINLCILPL